MVAHADSLHRAPQHRRPPREDDRVDRHNRPEETGILGGGEQGEGEGDARGRGEGEQAREGGAADGEGREGDGGWGERVMERFAEAGLPRYTGLWSAPRPSSAFFSGTVGGRSLQVSP